MLQSPRPPACLYQTRTSPRNGSLTSSWPIASWIMSATRRGSLRLLSTSSSERVRADQREEAAPLVAKERERGLQDLGLEDEQAVDRATRDERLAEIDPVGRREAALASRVLLEERAHDRHRSVALSAARRAQEHELVPGAAEVTWIVPAAAGSHTSDPSVPC